MIRQQLATQDSTDNHHFSWKSATVHREQKDAKCIQPYNKTLTHISSVTC